VTDVLVDGASIGSGLVPSYTSVPYIFFNVKANHTIQASFAASPTTTMDTWGSTSSLSTARTNHTAILLPNGKVLVAGGTYSVNTALYSAELYDPATGTWTTTGAMNIARSNHTATRLPNGKVLVAGGFGETSIWASAELYRNASVRFGPAILLLLMGGE
jgi:hypothetical protein